MRAKEKMILLVDITIDIAAKKFTKKNMMSEEPISVNLGFFINTHWASSLKENRKFTQTVL